MQIYGKNVEITEPLQVYIEEKLSSLYKLNSDILSIRCDLHRDQHHHKGDIFTAEVHVSIPGRIARVRERGSDAREVIDIAAEKLMRQLRGVKERKLSLRRLRRLFKKG